jgi:hypothetical protein
MSEVEKFEAKRKAQEQSEQCLADNNQNGW